MWCSLKRWVFLGFIVAVLARNAAGFNLGRVRRRAADSCVFLSRRESAGGEAVSCLRKTRQGVGSEHSQHKLLSPVVDVLDCLCGGGTCAALMPNAGGVICSRVDKICYQLEALG